MTRSSVGAEQNVLTSSSDHTGTTIENDTNDTKLVASADSAYGAELEASKDSAYGPELVSDAELEANAGGTKFLSSMDPLSRTRTAQFETCNEVDRLEPQECGDEFTPGKVWVFARIKAPENELLTLIW